MLAVPRQVTYTDLGGIEGVLSDIRELIEYPLQHPEVRIIQISPILDRSLYLHTLHTHVAYLKGGKGPWPLWVS